MIKALMRATYKVARRIVISVVGVTVILVGIAMIVAPGPAIVVIPLGLAILGIEFAWARRWLKQLKNKAKSAFDTVTNAGKPNHQS